jgi:hypothetical protein
MVRAVRSGSAPPFGRFRCSLPLSVAALSAVLLSGGSALAQAPAGVPGAESFAPSLRAADEGTPKPYADDERTGHILLRGAVGLAAPAGSVAGDAAFADVASTGAAFGGSLGVGLSRHAVLDLSASYALFGRAERCEGCSASSFSGSLGLSYHLTQGAAIDPWIRFGAGFRAAKLDTSSATGGQLAGSGSYLGIDVAQLAFGASFAPIAGVAFGPFLGLDLGTFVERPSRWSAAGEVLGTSAATHALFLLGLRFELDPVRWNGASPTRSEQTALSRASARPVPAPSALAQAPVQSAVVTRPNDPL